MTTQLLFTCTSCHFADYVPSYLVTLTFLAGRWTAEWDCAMCGARRSGELPEREALEIADGAARDLDAVAAAFLDQMGKGDPTHEHTAACGHRRLEGLDQ